MRVGAAAARTNLLILVAICLFGATRVQAQNYVRDSGPELLSYDELVQLSVDQQPKPELAEKVRAITTTPFVNNEAYFSGARPRDLEMPLLGHCLRIAFWNIERGLELDDILLFLKDKDAFLAKVEAERKEAKENKKRIRAINLAKLPEEIDILKAADVWILNEVDWGVKRTDYREVIRELGQALNMNWAYGVEFLEIDPKQLGTDTFDDGETQKEQEQLREMFEVDRDRLRALHGNAVLSRYPIRNARLVPFTVGYDWFKESKIRPLEKAKRKAAVLVGEDLSREMRRGQRTTLYVDLDVPDAPLGQVTIASTHLENRAKPSVRRRQLLELLNEVRDVPNPVIIGGDMNSTGGNGTPTSVPNMLYRRYGSLDFWTTKGIQWTTGVGMVYTGTKTILSLSGIQYRIDPTSANVPGASPNQERALFTTLEKFRFADGKAIDFRGVRDHTVNGTAGTLADSNQRKSSGFVPTFEAQLVWGKVRVAKFKLDWFFVKDSITEPRDVKGSYLFAPALARTLVDLNNCLPEPISDHSPMTIDLPFKEPTEFIGNTPPRSAR